MKGVIPSSIPGVLRRFATVEPVSSSIAKLHCVRGSVVDYGMEAPPRQLSASAIVNAANEGCLDGGGVDGAINLAGGSCLEKDRFSLPILSRGSTDGRGVGQFEEKDLGVRCYTGSAVVTGPNRYGDLHVPFVIHAVGPNYWNFSPDDAQEGHSLLASAYGQCLDRAFERGIQFLGFSLLSAGVFRARVPLVEILITALQAIKSWTPKEIAGQNASGSVQVTVDDDGLNVWDPSQPPIMEVTLCAYTEDECSTLVQACEFVFAQSSDAMVESCLVKGDVI